MRNNIVKIRYIKMVKNVFDIQRTVHRDIFL